MSEIKVNSIKGVGASAAAITVNNTDGTCTANITNNLSNRNKIINGAMSVHQRGTSSTGITGSDYYTADRMQLVLANGGTWTNTISTDTPDGFAASYKLDCTTADASLGGDDLVLFRQIIEGHNLQDFAKGTSSAKQFTVSFYVKTNKTGNYVCELLDDTNSRQVSKSYTVSNTNWNRYTVTFPADTSGAIADSNAAGLYVHFWLAAGTNFTSGTQQTSWASNTKANRVNGLNVNIADNTSNEWLITGIQLEVGSVATDFEHRSFGQELALCERYYYRLTCDQAGQRFGSGFQKSGSAAFVMIPFPTTMRTRPTALETSGTASDYTVARTSTYEVCNVVPVFEVASIFNCNIGTNQTSASLNTGQGVMLRANTTNFFLGFSAEL
jgi:hypothetical protein